MLYKPSVSTHLNVLISHTAKLTIEGTQSPTLRGSRSTTLELKSVYTTRRASRSHSVRCCCVLNNPATYTDSLLAVFWIFLTLYLHKRDQRRAQAEAVPATLVDDDASIEKDVLSEPSGQQGEWARMFRQVQ
jgi:hypothetical protein